MFDRQTYLLESLRALSTFTGETKTGNRVKDEPYSVVKNFAHSYSVYRRLFANHLGQIDGQPLDELYELVKEIEAPFWDAKPIQWLRQDVKKNRFWRQLRDLAGRGAVLIESLPEPPRERPIKRLPLAVVYYGEERIDNPPPPEETEVGEEGVSENDINWYGLREDLLTVLEKHGLTGPDDPAEDPHFYLVDDRYNEERYHYMEVYKPSALTLNWLKDTTGALRNHPGWGVGVKNLQEGYLFVFADRLLVTGQAFRHCTDALSVLDAVKMLI
jgi:hypothetical protein